MPAQTVEHKIELLQGQASLMADLTSDVLAAIAGCVAGDTLIDCPGGPRRIKDLVGFTWIRILDTRLLKFGVIIFTMVLQMYIFMK